MLRVCEVDARGTTIAILWASSRISLGLRGQILEIRLNEKTRQLF
jgi:hypothetical protein